MKKHGIITELTSHNALHQSIIGILLLAVIPLLSILYIGSMVWIHPEELSVNARIMAVVFTGTLALAGFLILLKFPRNIIKLRQYISDVATGALPEKVNLLDTRSSDDLKFIEDGLNAIIREMREQVERAEEQQRVEHDLRETIERQHACIVHAEQHRAMVQSLGAACHHLGQPVTAMEMRLHLMKMIENVPNEELVQIEECEKGLQQIEDILEKLRLVSEFRTEPYIQGSTGEDSEILSI